MSDQAKKTYVHIVRERYCKGCNICVSFCPKKVLALKAGKVSVESPELCIGCRMCELRCPDFAIEVHEKGQEPAQASVDGVDYCLPPEACDD
jgi:2-oxoglutarate ferredoxin oxidoreductase subunit delta